MGESERKSCGTVFPIVGLTELSELSTIKWFSVSTVELSSKFTELLSLISGSSLSDGVSRSNPKEFGKLVTGSAKVLSETEALTFAGRLRSISGVGALSGSAKIVLLWVCGSKFLFWTTGSSSSSSESEPSNIPARSSEWMRGAIAFLMLWVTFRNVVVKGLAWFSGETEAAAA